MAVPAGGSAVSLTTPSSSTWVVLLSCTTTLTLLVPAAMLCGASSVTVNEPACCTVHTVWSSSSAELDERSHEKHSAIKTKEVTKERAWVLLSDTVDGR